MKKFLSLIFVIGLLLSACGTVETSIHPSVETSTPTLTPTATQTSIPPTTTITPLPTIPTFTPTFDVSTIVTVTPAEKAECPKEDPTLVPKFQIPTKDHSIFGGTEKEILEFLNKGGSVSETAKRLSNAKKLLIQDVTGDSIKELIFLDFGAITWLHIFVCSNGKYKLYSPYNNSDGSYYNIRIISISDMNLNQVPDIIVQRRGCSGTGCFYFQILEWNGNEFFNLSPDAEVSGVEKISVQNVDTDPLLELRVEGGIPGQGSFAPAYPWREEFYTYKWNGKLFSRNLVEYSSPQFRFQASQDADRATLIGEYDKALLLYQNTIFSDHLDWWSPKRQLDTYYELLARPYDPSVEKPAQGSPDLIEYPSLAAYAYYRIMLLHLVQGQEAEAISTYQTLQDTFGNDLYGSPYAEMAAAFWESYQSTHNMYDGCASAIQYAVEHPEILVPLGSDYHGWQSKVYKPEDVCPFR